MKWPDGLSRKHLHSKTIMYFALRNLQHKRFRSSLTTIGVVIGVGSVYLLLSFGIGLQSLVQKQITNGETINTIDVGTSNSKVISLTPQRVTQIKTIPGVKDVSGTYTAAGKLALDDASVDVVTYGVDQLYIDLDVPDVSKGRHIDADKTDEATISGALLNSIGVNDPKGVLGRSFNIKIDMDGQKVIEKKFKIVGVLDSATGSEVFVSHKVFSDTGITTYSQVKILASNRESIAKMRHTIESLGLDTASPIDTLEQVDRVFRFFSIALAGLGSVGMLIAVLGMLNTLTVSLLERTREIALMMMLGGRPRDMLKLFVSEALILSVTGGILGILSALGVGFLADKILNRLAQNRGVDEAFTAFAQPWWLSLGMLVFMVGVGLVVAYFPARRAARINPVEVLRQE